MSVLIGLDIGTSGVRALAVRPDGEIMAEATDVYAPSRPRPGWSEQDPEIWWAATRRVLRAVTLQVSETVTGIGLAGQMHGSVLLDAAGDVIRPALLWNDQRTASQCADITRIVGEERLLAIAANPALTGFQAPKILWLRDNEPERYARLAHVLLPKDYVRYRLTGEFATDVSDASGTLLLDVRRRTWSTELCDLLDIPFGWLPDVHEGPEVTGQVQGEVARELNLPQGVPVIAGGGDNAAAAIGVGVVRPGMVSISIGTSGVVFAHLDAFTPDPSGRLHAFCHAVPGAWHVMGVTLSAGSALAWWRDVVGRSWDDLVAVAADITPGAEGLVFLPYLNGERTPHMDPLARGAFIGLTARHGLAHMTRAVMEGVVHALRDSLDGLRSLGVPVDHVRATGGGAPVPLWRRLQADIFGLPIHRTTGDEGPAFGAALLAGVATGVYADVRDSASVVRLRDDVTVPDPVAVRAHDAVHDIYRSLYPAISGPMHRLAGLG